MANPLLIDLSHTSHTLARTGIQRVSRSIWRELGNAGAPVTYDPHEEAWRPLEGWEIGNLQATRTQASRRAKWPLIPVLRGRLRQLTGQSEGTSALAPSAGLVVPEIFSAEVASVYPDLFSEAGGARVALFHDAIALQYPEFAPRSTVMRFPGYLQDLLKFDAVAAVSEASRDSLLAYWKWLGVSKMPEVTAIPLGVDPAPPRPPATRSEVPTVLCVATIEGRKNHLNLLEACESLWSAKASFQLRLVGSANSETGSAATDRIALLRASGRNIRYEGALSEADLESAYAECTFTVYPSFTEGFGLPVAESLSRGKPCACRFEGALGEIARGGGCRDIGQASPSEIASAIGSLLASPSELAELGAAAGRRRFKTWAKYTAELSSWVSTVKILP